MDNRTTANPDVRIALTAGLLAGLGAMVLLHALTLATAQRVAPHIEHAIFETAQTNAPNPPRGGINFDESRNAGGVVNTLPVNSSARDEVKRQEPYCVPCNNPPAVVAAPSGNPAVQPVPPVTPNARTPMVAKPTTPRYSIEVFVLHNDPDSETILNWFNNELQSWKKSTNFNVYTKDNPIYLTRFAHKIPASSFPVVLVTDPRGGDVYACDRQSRPESVRALSAAVTEAKRIQAEVVARNRASDPPVNDTGQTQAIQSGKDSLLDAIVNECKDGKCDPPFWRRPTESNETSDSVQGLLRMIVRPGESIFQIVIILAVVVTFIYFIKRGRAW